MPHNTPTFLVEACWQAASSRNRLKLILPKILNFCFAPATVATCRIFKRIPVQELSVGADFSQEVFPRPHRSAAVIA